MAIAITLGLALGVVALSVGLRAADARLARDIPALLDPEPAPAAAGGPVLRHRTSASIGELAWATDTLLEALREDDPAVTRTVVQALAHSSADDLRAHTEEAFRLFGGLVSDHRILVVTAGDAPVCDFWATLLRERAPHSR